MKKKNIIKICHKVPNRLLLIAILIMLLGIICLILGYKINILNYFLGALLIIIGIFYLYLSLNIHSKVKKSMLRYSPSEIDDINEDISDPLIHDKNNRIYYTDHSVIDYHNGLDMFRFNEVIWVFPHIIRHNKKEREWYIAVITQDKRKHLLKNIKNFEKVDKGEYNDLMKFITDRCHNITIGYSDESINYIKEKYHYEYK